MRMTEQLNADAQEIANLKARIAKLERSEAHHQKKYEHLHQFYNRAPIGYQVLDKKAALIEINQAWLNKFGYSREEVMGRNFRDFLAPEWHAHFEENFSNTASTGQIIGVELAIKRKDSSLHSGYYGRQHCC